MAKKRLPLGAAIRMGLRGLKGHPWRLIIVVLLTVCSLVMFGLTVTAATYNEEVIRAQSYSDYEAATVVYVTDEEGEARPVLQSDLDTLSNETGISFSPLVYDELLVDYWRFIWVSFDQLPRCMKSGEYLNQFCYLSQEALDDAGFTLYGRLPENKYEIALNSCWAETFCSTSFYDAVTYPPTYDEDMYYYVPDEEGFRYFDSANELAAAGVSMFVKNPEGGEYAAKIVGVVDYGECETRNDSQNGARGYYDAVFVSKEYLQSYMQPFGDGAIGMALVAGKVSSVKAAALLSYCEESDFALMSPVLQNFEKSVKTVNQSRNAFTAAGCIFGVFAALLIYQFVTLSVKEKSDQIGVLRALGAHASDVYKIFFTESLLLALIDIVLAIPITLFMCNVVNHVLYAFFWIEIKFMYFNFITPLAIILIGFGVTLAATFFPVYRMAKKQPVDCIRDCN